MSDLQVRHNPDRSRWEAQLDGEVVGFVEYRLRDDTVVVPHTETDPRFGGQGVAAAVTRALLDDARAAGRTVVPACPYTASWIARHPDYQDLVASA